MRYIILITCLLSSILNTSLAQVAGDYRSKQTGAWNIASSWQTFNGSSWVDATTSPSSSSGKNTILSGHEITVSTNITADQVIINKGATLSISGGTFTVANGSGTDLTCSGTLALRVDGTLNGAGTITCASGSALEWYGGTIGGSGSLTINAGAAFNMSNSYHSLSDTKTINNSGIWTWTGGTFDFENSSSVINAGTFNINTDADVSSFNSAAASFVNKSTGIINKIGSPSDETSFDGIKSFTNGGTININSSSIIIFVNATDSGKVNIAFGANMSFSGTTNFTAKSVLKGSGSITIRGGASVIISTSVDSLKTINIEYGTLTMSSSLTIDSGKNLNLWNGGTLNGSGPVVVKSGGTFNWNGGAIGGSGSLTVNAGAALNMSGGPHYLYDTKTINNLGIWTWTGGALYYDNSSTVVNNAGTFNINTDEDVSGSNSSTASFVNKPGGIVNKIGSPTGETIFESIKSFTNGGTINVNSGKIRLYISSVDSGTINVALGAHINYTGGVASFTAKAVLKGAGSLNFDGAANTSNTSSMAVNTINLSSGTLTLTTSIIRNSGSTFNLSGGTLNGIGSVSFASGSKFNWRRGTIGGSGNLNINAGAAFSMSEDPDTPYYYDDYHYLSDTKTINNSGIWTWTGGRLYYSNSSSVINNAGTFNINTDDDIEGDNSSTASFINKPGGIINKIGSPSDETSFSNISSFSNSGTININSSNINLNVGGTHSGTYKIAFGSELRGNNNMSFTGSSFTNNGTVTLPDLSFTGSTVQSLKGTGKIYTLSVSNKNGISLGGTQTINTALNLTRGRITSGNYNLIAGTAATLSGGSDSSYIVTNGTGSLQRRVTNDSTAVLFPVGHANSYMPVTMQLSTLSTADNFKVRLLPNLYGGYDAAGKPTGNPVNGNVVNGTWFISEGTAGGSDATFSVQWNTADESAGFKRTDSRRSRYSGNTWKLGTVKAASGSNPFTFTSTKITSFSQFGIINQFVSCLNTYAPLCAGQSVSIPYKAVGAFSAGNVFTAQLSDSSGSFGTPVNIASRSSTVSGSINATIPGTTASASGYRIRIINSNPSLTSPDNGSNISIGSCITATAANKVTCPAPENLNVSDITSAGVKLKWNTTLSANNSYQIQFKKALSDEWKVVNATATTLSFDYLEPNTAYNVRVKGECASGFSPFSEVLTFTTLKLDSNKVLAKSFAQGLSIYPNPNNGQFTILQHFKEAKTGYAHLEIVNAAGQRIYSDKIPVSGLDLKKTISLPPSAPSGIYVITILAGKDVSHGKIVCRKGL